MRLKLVCACLGIFLTGSNWCVEFIHGRHTKKRLLLARGRRTQHGSIGVWRLTWWLPPPGSSRLHAWCPAKTRAMLPRYTSPEHSRFHACLRNQRPHFLMSHSHFMWAMSTVCRRTSRRWRDAIGAGWGLFHPCRDAIHVWFAGMPLGRGGASCWYPCRLAFRSCFPGQLVASGSRFRRWQLRS